MPDKTQEEKLIDEILAIEGAEYEETILDEATRVIQKEFGCSNEAAVVFRKDLETRKLIERELTQSGGQLVELKRTRTSLWRWRRPK
jgi:hypothetical protein